ncbi:hypothetical protein GUITHDRAFT_119234 [Guillardia theta CCMP2712]|uniref:Methyltransferase domain-containing protein n=1 Tax=Guillardia theta (strain CCMP2712) TaxID=905079 RepID=L1IFF2_GUITC|nr:hypothetical protein GUITHDRAFT_119234 [Guillardia theta CCMP2712]EKX34585.1 hypothetical protein GUITHDRAFT_119234 [Guillardia theta CCMP2712]|eukprot:XP_005821565.1 hypothetical protein GUITHDRAFT_119234 [Guillardia theta CCMP2712]
MNGPILDASSSSPSNPPPDGDKLFSAPASRNVSPILDVMKTLVPQGEGKVLAVAEGSGQHVSCFAKNLPLLKFVATDLDSKAVASIRAYVKEEGVSNVLAIEQLDMTAVPHWEEKSWASSSSFDLVYAVNLTHISPWAASLGLLATAARLLREGGVLMIYGPFKVDGKCTTESNEEFDKKLRSQNSEWGYRDIDDLKAAGSERGLKFVRAESMPANNFILIFNK